MSDFISISGINHYELEPTEAESKFMELLASWCEDDRLRFERRSSNYISAVIGINDFIRFKLSDRVQWFSIALARDLYKVYENSPLFADQENKRVCHWKVKFKDFSDLEPYKDIIKKSCVYME